MLRQYLQSMLDDAAKNLKVPVKRKLKGNLHIALAMTESAVHLSISRDKVYPSESEWKTTLSCFPYFVEPSIVSNKFIDSDRRFAMRAKLPRREAPLKQLAFSAQQPAKAEDEHTDTAQDAAV